MSILAATVAAGTGGAAIAALSWATFAPTSSVWGNIYSRAPSSNSNNIALTFDDGPTPESTKAILDILGELDVPAAFFVIGVNARQSPKLLERMRDEGHIVANHSL